MNKKTMCITGHRPNKLYGYDYMHKSYIAMGHYIRKFILDNAITDVYSGMALGVDTICALVVLKLKRQGYAVKLHCAIPCKNHASNWPAASQKQWQDIINQADFVEYVSEKAYDNTCMQKRNIYMVDRSDIVLGIWDGTSGGTKNCLDYAKSESKTIQIISPNDLK